MKIFPTAQVLWALSLSLLVCLFLSAAICFSLLFFCKYLFIFHLLMLLKFGLWLFIQLSQRTVCICLVMFVWLFHVGHYCSPAVDIIFVDTHDQFPLGGAHPLQVVFRCWFMLLTGSFWSPLVTCKDVAGRPSVSCGRARCLIFSPPPTPLPPRRYMYNVKCERSNIMWKNKPSACTVLGISSSGWGFERRLVTVEASIYEAHYSFLSVLHQRLVLALLCVAHPPVVLLEQSRHQPHVLNVKTSIPRPPYSRSLQNVCSDRRWVSTTSNTFAFVR